MENAETERLLLKDVGADQPQNQTGGGLERDGPGVDLNVIAAGLIHVGFVVALEIVLPVCVAAADVGGRPLGRGAGSPGHPLNP